MSVKLTFDPNSSLTISDMTKLIDLVAFETPLENITSTSFTGTGVRYTGPGQPYGMDATFSATGTGFQYITLGSSFLYSGIIDTVTVTHQGTDITMSDMGFDMDTLVPILQAESSQIDTLALERFMFQLDWDATLSNNADIAPAGSIVADGANFNLLGDDIIRTMGGNDDLFTGDGDDKVWGGGGDDRLDGGMGADVLYGGSGSDELIGAKGADRLYGKGGADSLSGGGGRDNLNGGSGDDELSGNKGKDVLYGKNGADLLMGGGGADKIYASRGNDNLFGGGGADDFIFRNGQGDNVIHDFNATRDAEDIILKAVSAITSFSDLSSNHMLQVGADVLIDDGANMTITLLNVNMSDLDAEDFLF